MDFYLYSRESCHLCHEFKRELDSLLAGRNHRCRVVDVDSDPELVRLYGLRLPVLVADGREICEGVIDEAAVRTFIGELDHAG